MDKNTNTFYDVVVILSTKGDLVKGCGQAGSTQVAALVGEVDADRIGQKIVDFGSQFPGAVVYDVVSSHKSPFSCAAFDGLDKCSSHDTLSSPGDKIRLHAV